MKVVTRSFRGQAPVATAPRVRLQYSFRGGGPMPHTTSRRDFVKRAAAGASVATLARRVIAQTSKASAAGVPTRELGRTKERVSIVCLGGWHIRSIKDDAESIRVMHAAIDE